jgi:hypothetical protein
LADIAATVRKAWLIAIKAVKTRSIVRRFEVRHGETSRAVKSHPTLRLQRGAAFDPGLEIDCAGR